MKSRKPPIGSRNWTTADSHRVVKNTFLDIVEWLRQDGPDKPFGKDQWGGRFGHLKIDYSNLHVVAALLTQAQLSHYADSKDVKTRVPLEEIQ